MNVEALVEQKTKETNQMTVKEQLEKRFVYSGKNIDALETAYQLNKSIVLWGKGG